MSDLTILQKIEHDYGIQFEQVNMDNHEDEFRLPNICYACNMQQQVTLLKISFTTIKNLQELGLENFGSLRNLDLSHNQFSNDNKISVLAHLTNLIQLNLDGNLIVDISWIRPLNMSIQHPIFVIVNTENFPAIRNFNAFNQCVT